MTQTNATNADRFVFAGMEYDSVTGLYYDHARYYDAVIGRFVSQDPMGFAAGDTDLYRYVGNAPTEAADTSGYQGPGFHDPDGGPSPRNPLDQARNMYRFAVERLEDPPILRPVGPTGAFLPPGTPLPPGPVIFFPFRDPIWEQAVRVYLRRILINDTSTLGDWPSGQGSLLIEDTKSGEERSDLGSVATKGLGDIGRAGDPEEADRRITQSGHDFGTGTLADSARVLAERDVTYVMGPILD